MKLCNDNLKGKGVNCFPYRLNQVLQIRPLAVHYKYCTYKLTYLHTCRIWSLIVLMHLYLYLKADR